MGAAPARIGERLQPLAFTSGRGGAAIAVAAVMACVLVGFLEAARTGLTSLGSLLFLPVLAAAWFLDRTALLVVAAVAVATRLVSYRFSGNDLGTAIAEAVMIVVIAALTRLAATGLVAGQRAGRRLAEQERRLELVADRERIAGEVNETAVQKLFGVTLQLEAAAALLPEGDAKRRVQQAVAEVDDLNRRLREVVFSSNGPPAEVRPRS